VTINDTTVVQDVEKALRAAAGRIAPVWPLERFVAVNPYLGLADHGFAEAAERLAATGGARATLPTRSYLDAVEAGRISRDDLAAALAASGRPVDVDGLLARVAAVDDAAAWAPRVPTVADEADRLTGTDWTRLCVERVSAWAAAHFDAGQALWRSRDRAATPFRSWLEEARVDRTPGIMGLRGFRAVVRDLPEDAVAAAELALGQLDVPGEGLELYLHRLLLRVGGWSAHAARLAWEANLRGEEDGALVDLLAVLLCWELALLRTVPGVDLAAAWRDRHRELRDLGEHLGVRDAVADRIVLQDAFDRSEQRRLIARFPAPPGPAATPRPEFQAVFCIDVRSEVLRRHLEAVAGGEVQTIGFAGFFGVPLEYVPLAHERGEAQCPVLLSPSHTVAETVAGGGPSHEEVVAARRLTHHVRRAWKSFKMGAVSCFSFVGPVGLIYLPKLFTDATGRSRPVPRPEVEALPAGVGRTGPTLEAVPGPAPVGIPLADRIQLAEGALRAMSLTDGFAPLVLIAGHGATTVNNPYDTGLDCGACGGHTGEANARVAAAILNDPDVRAGLVARGITIPDDTWFLAAQHDTTTDRVELFDPHLAPPSQRDRIAALASHLSEAGHRTRVERASRLGLAGSGHVDDDIVRRSTDWAQVRPEWGLAGCRAFVVAPRHRTAGIDLGGRAFLHSYDWRRDSGFGVLELIMTAPMVVASWISLQYYASTVENRLFGSGNKTLHNVVGRLGVLEGNGGDLRVGLPWQSVHDGDGLQHEPLRLQVVIEAPVAAMNDVLESHPGVRDLCDHGWLHLLAMDDDGRISHRYAGDLRWEPVEDDLGRIAA
jgi:uncharacterized protein YbcC (UPF0753/DUF2309 family)